MPLHIFYEHFEARVGEKLNLPLVHLPALIIMLNYNYLKTYYLFSLFTEASAYNEYVKLRC